MTAHQEKQLEVINKIEDDIKNNTRAFSTVPPVDDYERDSRMAITSVHFPHKELVEYIDNTIISPLKNITGSHYYYPPDGFHMTIKNVRVINDPPHFTQEDIDKAHKVFTEIVPHHKKFQVYFYRLLLFPNNISLIGTTDPELDNIILDLDKKLIDVGVPDDKKFNNSRYFFCNMTIARFNTPVTDAFREKTQELSKNISIKPYSVDSVSLITCNAVLKKLQIIDTWSLK